MRSVFAAICFVTAAVAQRPSFEAASIKEAAAEKRAPRMKSDPGRLVYTNVSLRDCFAPAYGLKPYEVLGPSYIDTIEFDIVATTSVATPQDQMMLMLQSLLADRFGVQFHRETRDLPVYVMELGKGKPRLRESTAAYSEMRYDTGGFVFSGVTIAELAAEFSRMRVDRPVIDRTGLTGRYDMRLEFEGEPGAVKRSMMDGSFSSEVIAAVSSQLGLKMKSTKAPVEMLIVDRAEKTPSEN